MLDDLLKIAQVIGWAPVSLLLAVAIVVGLFVFRERDATRIARIEYLEEKLKDCRAETPTAMVSRLRETVKTVDEEAAKIKANGEKEAQEYERRLGRANEATVRAEARLASLEQLRKEKEQADAERALRLEELQNERNAALMEAATLQSQLVQATSRLNQLSIQQYQHHGYFDNRIASAILYPGRDENVIYIPVRISYGGSQSQDEAELKKAILQRLEKVNENGGIVLRIVRDGVSKMGITVFSLDQELAGWVEGYALGWNPNDYYKTLLAILEFTDKQSLPTNNEIFVRARIEIHRVSFQGISPIDPNLAYLRVELLSDHDTVRDQAGTIEDKIR